jgi:uncharacterized membrane protein
MSKKHQQNHNAKKNAVLNSPKPKIKPLQILLVVSAILIIAAVAFIVSRPSTPLNNLATSSSDISQVTYPVAIFNDGKAHYFDFNADGLTIRYFILKSSDGVIRAAFDACDVCWPAGKGYFQEGDEMICRNCGRRFASIRVNEVKGGCNPAPLNRKVVGDQLVLKREDIIQGKSYFNFKDKV